jgi:hypothetical protein
MPPTSRKKMALLEGLDQYSAYYSVICVFGSVVGCVVVPLITQSIEGIILSAIVISITAKTIHSHSFNVREEPSDDRRRGAKDASIHDKRTKKKKLQPSSTRLVDNELVRRHRQEELIKLQEQRNIEKQQKFEERKLKKARKREEKLKQREEEEREREVSGVCYCGCGLLLRGGDCLRGYRGRLSSGGRERRRSCSRSRRGYQLE